MGAIELVGGKDPARAFPPAWAVGKHFVAEGMQAGFICRAIGDVMALSPPLVADAGHLEELLAGMGQALKATEAYVRGKERFL